MKGRPKTQMHIYPILYVKADITVEMLDDK